MIKPLAFLILAFSFAFTLTPAQQTSPPRPRVPAEMPAHDRHEGLVIAADPCLDALCSKNLFGKRNPFEAGILALDVYIKNEMTQAVRLNLSSVRLEVPLNDGSTQKLEPLEAREVATLIVYPAGAPNPSSGRRLPGGIVVPLHDKKVDQVTEQIRPRAFDADVIPPLATIRGYLFFNLSHNFALASSSTLYVPDLKVIAGGKTLMFFEVALAPAIQQTPANPPPASQ